MIKANNFENVFKVLMAIVFGAMTAGQSGAMAPDFGEACAAAHRVIKESCLIKNYKSKFIEMILIFSKHTEVSDNI